MSQQKAIAERMAATEKELQNSLCIINILREYNTNLNEVISDHPLLTLEEKTSAFKHLQENVHNLLVESERTLGPDPSDWFGMEISFLYVGLAKSLLLHMGYDLDRKENESPLDGAVAFSRLRRTEAYHACLKQIFQLRGSGAMQTYAAVEGTELFESMLAAMTRIPLPDAVSIGEQDDASSTVAGAHGDTPIPYGSFLLPCCKQAFQGCIQLRSEENECPLCHQSWSGEQVARLVYHRVRQLQAAVGARILR